jgi:hypothetical protein
MKAKGYGAAGFQNGSHSRKNASVLCVIDLKNNVR